MTAVIFFLRRHWFVVSLLVLLPLGTVLGLRASPDRVSSFPKHLVEAATGILTATVLLLMSLTLAAGRIAQSLRDPRAVVGAALINFGLIPLTALPLLPIQQSPDLQVGLMLAAAVPSTLAAAAVWTRKAGGNDAIALVVSVLTNSLCFLVTPLWLQLGCGSDVRIDTQSLMIKLASTALLPIVVGQAARLHPKILRFAERGRTAFGTVAQVLLLLVLFWAAVQGGVKLNPQHASSTNEAFRPGPYLLAWGSVGILHAVGLAAGFVLGAPLRLPRGDTVAMAFSGSQKTLPVGLFVAAGMIDKGLPLAAIPILMFHATQLVIDGLLIERLRRWTEGRRGE